MIQADRIALQFQHVRAPTIRSADSVYSGLNPFGAKLLFVYRAEVAELSIGVREEPDRSSGPVRHLVYGRPDLLLTPLPSLVLEDAMGRSEERPARTKAFVI